MTRVVFIWNVSCIKSSMCAGLTVCYLYCSDDNDKGYLAQNVMTNLSLFIVSIRTDIITCHVMIDPPSVVTLVNLGS